MTDLPGPVFQWMNQHPHLSGLLVFIISAGESVAIIGTIVPGSVMMTAIGALAGAGVIPLYSTLVWAIFGAIAGDGISYWIGRYFNTRLHGIWPFRGRPGMLASGETFFRRYGSMSVFIGRFVGPVRALVPLVAGMMGMEPVRFTIANVLSAIGWAPAYMLPGILLGAAALELPPDIAVHALIAIILGTLLVLLCCWLLAGLFRLVNRQIDQLLNNLWYWLKHTKGLQGVTTLLQHHDARKTHGQLALAFYLGCALVLFGLLTAVVFWQGSQDILLNRIFFHLFRSLRTPTADDLMQAISLMGDKNVLLPVIAILSAWFYWKKCPRTATHVLCLGLLTAGSIFVTKNLVHSLRPWGIAHPSHGYSFPSGHTTLAAAFFSAFTLMTIHLSRLRFRKPFYWLTGLCLLAVGISRLYLGMHWLTDVIGGYLLGAIVLLMVVISWNRGREKTPGVRSFLAVTFFTVVLSFSVGYYRQFDNLQQATRPLDWPTQQFSTATWWEHHDSSLPLYRINRFGLSPQILNLQWAGEPERIRTLLLAAGWQQPPHKNSMPDILHRISNVNSTEHLPLVAPIYLGEKPLLVLVKNNSLLKGLVVLRLWQSHVRFTDSTVPLMVGTIEQVPATYSWLSFRKQRAELPLTQLLFSNPPETLQIRAINQALGTHYSPPTRTLILIRSAQAAR